MKVSKILLTALFIAIFFFRSFAQSAPAHDYLINAHGDTIACKIKNALLGGSVKYKTSDMNIWKKIDAGDIREYYQAA